MRSENHNGIEKFDYATFKTESERSDSSLTYRATDLYNAEVAVETLQDRDS